MNQVQIIDRAKKLKELAERGISGEKDNAKRMYDLHKQKYNLTDEQVVGHKYTESFKVDLSNVSNDEFLNSMNDFLRSDTFAQLVKVLIKVMR